MRLKGWLETEISNLSPSSEIKQVNGIIEEYKQTLEELLGDKICHHEAVHRIEGLIIESTRILTEPENWEPDPKTVEIESEDDIEEWRSWLEEEAVKDEVLTLQKRMFHTVDIIRDTMQ